MKFNHLNVPDHYHHYWTRYPEGYTILEALLSWVKQVDDMVDNVNNWNAYLDGFVNTFDKELQKTVTSILSDWQDSGFLDVVISDALQTQIDDVEAKTNHNTEDLLGRGYDITRSVATTPSDWTDTIVQALQTHNHVFIPSIGTDYLVNGTITIPEGKILELGANVRLVKPDTATNTEPVIWMNASHSSLLGANRLKSQIVSYRETPNGVVALGYRNMNDTTGKNVLYCKIRDIGIVGHLQGGSTSGFPSVALNLANPQVNELASYFHDIHHIYLANTNIGILFEGWANANIIGDVQLINVGNYKQLGGGALVFKGSAGKAPLDNIVTNVFHHQSYNADTLVFQEDGAFYNIFTAINAEQGGPTARWLVDQANEDYPPQNNIITGVDNVGGGSSLNPDFLLTNTLTTKGYHSANTIYAKNLSTHSLRAIDFTRGNEETQTIEGSFGIWGLTEGTAYHLFELTCLSDAFFRTYTVEVTVNTYSTIDYIRSTHKAIFSVDFKNGSTTATAIQSIGTSAVITNPVGSGSSIDFGAKLMDNGTWSATSGFFVNYRIIGNTNIEVTPATGTVAIADPGVVPIG